MLRRSAMPESIKVATFSSEIIRRLKTTHVGIDQHIIEGILLELMNDLIAMGYTEDWRQKVLKSATTGYMRILGKVKSGELTRNRKGSDTLKTRGFKKLIGLMGGGGTLGQIRLQNNPQEEESKTI